MGTRLGGSTTKSSNTAVSIHSVCPQIPRACMSGWSGYLKTCHRRHPRHILTPFSSPLLTSSISHDPFSQGPELDLFRHLAMFGWSGYLRICHHRHPCRILTPLSVLTCHSLPSSIFRDPFFRGPVLDPGISLTLLVPF